MVTTRTDVQPNGPPRASARRGLRQTLVAMIVVASGAVGATAAAASTAHVVPTTGTASAIHYRPANLAPHHGQTHKHKIVNTSHRHEKKR